jgi:hypothetical protein
MRKIYSFSTFMLVLALLLTGAYSCKKEPGEGGSATIKGSIKIQNYNQVTHATIGQPYYAGREDVYIIYGDGTTYHDKIETSFDGSFAFRFLRTGKYKVYVYSDIVPAPASGAEEEAVIFDIDITDKKGTYEIPVTTVKKY